MEGCYLELACEAVGAHSSGLNICLRAKDMDGHFFHEI